MIKTPEREVEFFAKFRNSESDIILPEFLSIGFLNILYTLKGFIIAAAQKDGRIVM